jgi:hypothetical protein
LSDGSFSHKLKLKQNTRSVKLPNAEDAVILAEKLTDYLLSSSHPVGRFKAGFFRSLGYEADDWHQLEADLRLIPRKQ